MKPSAVYYSMCNHMIATEAIREKQVFTFERHIEHCPECIEESERHLKEVTRKFEGFMSDDRT